MTSPSSPTLSIARSPTLSIPRLGHKSVRPSVEIILDTDRPGMPPNFVNSFSTLDKISGHVIVKPSTDVPFKRLEISFRGFQLTKINQVASVTAASNPDRSAFHLFLELLQPNLHRQAPTDLILRAGETYKIPFEFTVPARLPVDHCRHGHQNDKFKLAHVLLPPSLGDKEVAGVGQQLFSDFSLDMWARVAYAVDFKLVVEKMGAHKNETSLSETKRKLRIIPAYDELPPVEIDGTDEEYRMRSEKVIRKNIMMPKTGSLVAQAYQPMSFRLPKVDATEPDDVRDTLTTVTVMLRFDPSDTRSKPPKVNKLSAKLRAMTYYSNKALRDFPSKKAIIYDITQGVWDETVPMLSRRAENSAITWHRHEPGTTPATSGARRPSISPTNNPEWIPEPSETYSPTKPFHTAQLLIPMSLPRKKAFVPSFYQCYISRVYIIDLSLDVEGGPIGGINLKLPVQISSGNDPEILAQLPSLSDAIENGNGMGESVDAYLNPRNVSDPAPQYQLTAGDRQAQIDEELPEYPPLASGIVTVRG